MFSLMIVGMAPHSFYSTCPSPLLLFWFLLFLFFLFSLFSLLLCFFPHIILLLFLWFIFLIFVIVLFLFVFLLFNFSCYFCSFFGSCSCFFLSSVFCFFLFSFFDFFVRGASACCTTNLRKAKNHAKNNFHTNYVQKDPEPVGLVNSCGRDAADIRDCRNKPGRC